MSFTAVAGVNGQFSGAASGTTLGIGAPSSTIPVGSLIIGTWVTLLASETATGIADNSTQPGAANVYVNFATVLSGTSISVGLFYCLQTTRAILATDTVTVTVGTAAAQKAAVLNAWTPSNGNAQFDTANLATTTSATASPVTTPSLVLPARVTDGVAFIAGGILFPAASTTWAVTAPAAMTLGVHPADPGAAPHVESFMAWKDNAGVNTFTSSETFTSITRAHVFAGIFTDEPGKPRIKVVRRNWAGR